MTQLVPCLLDRKIIPKPWGGRGLQELLGIELPPDVAVGETWEVYDRPDGSSRIRGTDRTLHELLLEDRESLLGPSVRPTREGRFPLALKFLDAREPLSVQVHPDDEQAKEEGDSGKSEAWVVLACGERARVLRGFRPGVTRERFDAIADSEAVTELLEAVTPAPGDTVRIPAGTVHSLGPDVVVFEIQRNSGITYRLFDWGRGREQHFEQGSRAAVFGDRPETVVSNPMTADGGEWLVRDPHFDLMRYVFDQPRTFATGGSFKVITFLEGLGAIGWRSQGVHDPLRVARGDSVLIPACANEVFVSPIGRVTALVSSPGRGV